MQTQDFFYSLPASRIAQTPCRPRDHAQLMVLNRQSGKMQHQNFFDLPNLLSAGDVLVFNNSQVIKARLIGKKSTGGKMEIFLLKRISKQTRVGNSRALLRPDRRRDFGGSPSKNSSMVGDKWEVLVGGRGARDGQQIFFNDDVSCTIQKTPTGFIATWNLPVSQFEKWLARHGQVPLPPYIHTPAKFSDYQTVFATKKGSVAAPTAGLHFTPRLFQKLKARGVQYEFITLHVGLGTFKPITTDRVEDHAIHSEFAHISPATAARLNRAKKEGRRIIAVGTTSVRTLEDFTDAKGKIHSGARDVQIFMYPGYGFRCVDAMITNFHLPKSSLLVLVSAFASQEKILRAYKIAIRKKYRFYSFGDAMLIH